jgi:thiosulfate/3-mercaptopyruvate sulfurtransferase
MAFQTLISTRQALAGLECSDWLFVDCRHQLADEAWGEREYRTGHLPGAHFLHLDRDLSGAKTGCNGRHPLPDVATLAEKLRKLGMNQDSQVVVYDQGNGAMAARLWWLCRWLGHARVAVLDGGYAKWQAEGLPLSSQSPEAVNGDFQERTASDCLRDCEWLLSHLGDAGNVIVDARTADRFAGENETLDPLGGHIPGAINRPWPNNLAADGCFKSAEVLRAEFQSLLGNVAPTAIVNQCGSGVTACHNILAMEVAGLSGSRLYPGSWSEWCADPSRPMVLRQGA